MRYKHAGTDDTLFDGTLLESQEGDGRVGGVYRETSGHDGKRSAEGVREDIQREIKYFLKKITNEAVPETKKKTLFVVSAFIGNEGYKRGASQLINTISSPDATSEIGSVVTPNKSIPQTSSKSNPSAKKT